MKTTIVDPHIHLWDPKNTPKSITPLIKAFGWSPWLLKRAGQLLTPKPLINFVGPINYAIAPHLPPIYHRDTGKYNVDAFVHIQAGWEGKTPIDSAGEVAWVDTLDEKPVAIVGEAHLNDLAHLDSVLKAHANASSRFRGIRDMVAGHPKKEIHSWNSTSDTVMQTDKWRKGYSILADRDLTFDCFLYSNQLNDFADLTAAIPQTKVVLDHIGTPVGLSGVFCGVGLSPNEREKIKNDWYEGLSKVAANEHVRLKLSGLFMPILGYGFEKRKDQVSLTEVVDAMAPHIEYAIQTFGIDRCMFASNFPMDKVSLTFEMLYDAYFQIVQNYTMEDKHKLFCQNALDFYGVTL